MREGERSEAEGGFQPIKALQGCPEYAEEAWCKISARSVKSFYGYGQKTTLSVSLSLSIIYIYICVCIQLWPPEDKS